MTPAPRRSAGARLHRLIALGVLAISPLAAAGAQQSPARLAAQGEPVSISLDEALATAESRSETVRAAAAGVDRARGQFLQARSQVLPQLNTSLVYQRAIQNQFNEIGKDAARAQAQREAQPGYVAPPPAVCAPRIPENATPEQRAAALAAATTCAPGDGGFGAIGRIFASPNTAILGVTGSQLLFGGGRVVAGYRAAQAGERAAQVGLVAARAQLRLDVTQAYFDAALTDRLVAIAESTFVQSERTFRQASLAQQVGTTSEFDLLRAQVVRDNQRPVVIQARSSREVAYLRLRQLLELPYDRPVRLTTRLGDDAPPPAPALAAAPADALPNARPAVPVRPASNVAVDAPVDVDALLAEGGVNEGAATGVAIAAGADTAAAGRAPVRQASQNVEAQRQLVRVARGQRLPGVQLSTNYQRFAYPQSLGRFGGTYPNWTVAVGVAMPIFTGGRIRGEEMIARANLAEATAQLEQVRELAALDARLALAQLEQAAAAYQASFGTSSQAGRAYQIAELRYREGISTQVELNDARLLLQQAQANRAQAARDLRVSETRLALLRDLPLQLGTGAGAGQGNPQQGGAGPMGGAMGGGGAGGAGGRAPRPQSQQGGPPAQASQASGQQF